MAHYPRGRDRDQDGTPADGTPADSAPADGTPADSPPAMSPSTPPEDATGATGATTPADPGAIAGWSPPSPPSSADAPPPRWPTPEATPTWPDAGSPTVAARPDEGWIEPTAPAPSSSRGAVGGLVRRFWILGVIAVIGIGAFVLRDRLTGGAGDLAVGDCFDLPASELEEVEEVQHHPCTDAHTGEVILVYKLAGEADEYPSNDTFFTSIEEQCVPAFAAYTGTEYASQETLDIFWLTPSREGWRNGDREISCALYRFDDAPMTESMKGSNPT